MGAPHTQQTILLCYSCAQVSRSRISTRGGAGGGGIKTRHGARSGAEEVAGGDAETIRRTHGAQGAAGQLARRPLPEAGRQGAVRGGHGADASDGGGGAVGALEGAPRAALLGDALRAGRLSARALPPFRMAATSVPLGCPCLHCPPTLAAALHAVSPLDPLASDVFLPLLFRGITGHNTVTDPTRLGLARCTRCPPMLHHPTRLGIVRHADVTHTLHHPPSSHQARTCAFVHADIAEPTSANDPSWLQEKAGL